jgi:NAD(P)-dependent dehydrogenase (short-subunit alcohol dehydrogenase family)/acyl carrier protein
VLTSRRGAAAEGAAELEEELAGLGAKVTIAACDVADRDALAALLDTLPDLTVVIHAAGVMQRIVPLSELTLDEFADVAAAKAGGAANLDELLADRPLDAFVLFSSGSAIWGSAGQAAYCSANAYLDGLAHRRRAQGRTATSIAWGPWGSGMVGDELAERLRRIGTPPMAPRRAVAALRRALDRDETHVVVADFDWSRFAPTYTLARPRPLLDGLPEVREILHGSPEEQGESALAARLAGMGEADQRRAILDLVRSHVAGLLGYDDPATLELNRPFDDLGFDSVAAVDLRNGLSAATGRKLPATMVFDYATPAALAEFLRSELCGDGAADVVPVLAELDRFESAVSAIEPEEIERTRIVARLRALVTRLDETVGGPGMGDRLDTASAEDVFDFIDRELGIA